MKHFWFIKIHPFFVGKDGYGNHIIFNNWIENIVDAFAENIEQAKRVLLLTGIRENEHYNEIIEQKD